jgi:4'-phosphopantetheinyl transferase EntD
MRNDEDAIDTGAVIIASRQARRPGRKRSRRGHQDPKSIDSSSCLILISMLLLGSSSSSRTTMRGVFVSGFASVRTKYPQSRSQWNALSKLQFLEEKSSIRRKGAFAVRNYHSSCYSTASAEQDTPTFAADFIPTTDSVSSTTTIETCYDRLFDIRLPEGRCVGLQLHELSEDDPNGLTPKAILDPDHTNTNTNTNHHWLHSLLHPEEVAYGMDRSCSNARESFFLGRLAMRQALGFGPHHVQTTDAILKDEYGRPAVPTGFLGSISHKRGTGVALVAVDDSVSTESYTAGSPRLGIGIDLEQICSQGKSSIARKVLTKREIENLGQIEVRFNLVALLTDTGRCVYRLCYGALLSAGWLVPTEVVAHGMYYLFYFSRDYPVTKRSFCVSASRKASTRQCTP